MCARVPQLLMRNRRGIHAHTLLRGPLWGVAVSTSLALASAVLSPASAGNATWRTVEYHAREQVTVDCAAALLCEIELQPGERVRDGLGSLVQLWDNHLIYEGANPGTPHLVVKPESAGLHENVLVTTSRRVYRLFLNSTTATVPTYMRFSYDDEQRVRDRHVARMRAFKRAREIAARPAPTAAPITTIDQACASMRQPGWRTDEKPAEYRPRQVCESRDHTFIALPASATEPTDLPVPIASTPDGDRPVNYRYDAASRVFTLDGTAPEYVLLATAGRRSVRMRVQRIEVKK